MTAKQEEEDIFVMFKEWEPDTYLSDCDTEILSDTELP